MLAPGAPADRSDDNLKIIYRDPANKPSGSFCFPFLTFTDKTASSDISDVQELGTSLLLSEPELQNCWSQVLKVQ